MLDNIYQINSKHTHTQQVKDSMSKHNKNYRKNELKIRRIEITPDRLTGRAGGSDPSEKAGKASPLQNFSNRHFVFH